jgi:hypothetical protein
MPLDAPVTSTTWSRNDPTSGRMRSMIMPA